MYKYVIIFLLALGLLTGCEEKKEQPKIIRPVKTMTLGQPQTTITRYFPGKVSASKEADISFQVTGNVIKLPILEGQKVKKGDLIAELDPEKYQQAVNATKAEYIRAEADYGRAKKIVEQGYITRAEFDKKKSEYLNAKAKYQTAQRDLNDTKLYAPFDGIIARKYIENYEYVAFKQPIAHLQNINNLDIEIDVPENVILTLQKTGKDKLPTPVVQFETLPDKSFPVTIKEYSLKANPDTRTFNMVFTMPHPQTVNILPGMTATIKAQLPDTKANGKGFFAVPSSAVFVDANKVSYVWLVDTNTMQVHKHQVTVSTMENGSIKITSGLKSGDVLVTAGVHYLQENEKVNFLESKSAGATS